MSAFGTCLCRQGDVCNVDRYVVRQQGQIDGNVTASHSAGNHAVPSLSTLSLQLLVGHLHPNTPYQ